MFSASFFSPSSFFRCLMPMLRVLFISILVLFRVSLLQSYVLVRMTSPSNRTIARTNSVMVSAQVKGIIHTVDLQRIGFCLYSALENDFNTSNTKNRFLGFPDPYFQCVQLVGLPQPGGHLDSGTVAYQVDAANSVDFDGFLSASVRLRAVLVDFGDALGGSLQPAKIIAQDAVFLDIVSNNSTLNKPVTVVEAAAFRLQYNQFEVAVLSAPVRQTSGPLRLAVFLRNAKVEVE